MRGVVSWNAVTMRSIKLTAIAALGAALASGCESGAPAIANTPAKPIVATVGKQPPAQLTDLTDSEPLVISGQSNLTISGKRIVNAAGHCIEIRRGSRNIRIVGSQIGPCGKDGVYIKDSADIAIEGNLFTDIGALKRPGSGAAVEFERSSGLLVRANRMERVSAGVYAPVSKRVVVEFNAIKNLQGPLPRGQMVQFNEVTGGGNAVRCNVLENIPGESGAVEDHINMYASSGAADDPILIEHNRTKGGESVQSSGCGVVIGDVSGGHHFRVRGNVFVNTGNCGIGLTAGSDVEITDNIVVSLGQKQANVGLLAWNLYGKGCAGNTFARNRVHWDASVRHGGLNNWWDGAPDKSCQPLKGWDSNQADPKLTVAQFDQPLPACQ